MDIASRIKPIALLCGEHKDTGTTGSGCFMNVIAYLNGEAQITDKSPCVDRTIRNIMVGVNDALNGLDRQRLIPFIHRAMGTAGAAERESRTRTLLMFGTLSAMLTLIERVVGDRVSRTSGFYAACDAAQEALRGGYPDTAMTCIGDAIHSIAELVYGTTGQPPLTEYWFVDPPADRPLFGTHISQLTLRTTSLGEVVVDMLIEGLDLMLPEANAPTQELIERADKLVTTYNAARAHALA